MKASASAAAMLRTTTTAAAAVHAMKARTSACWRRAPSTPTRCLRRVSPAEALAAVGGQAEGICATKRLQ